jgi:hypothetical protein
MILVTNIEDMENCVLKQFLLQLHPDKQNSNIVERDDDDPIHSTSPVVPNLYQLCQNCIVFLTSDRLGVTSIARHLRLSRGNLTHDNNALHLLSTAIRDRIGDELQDPTNTAVQSITTILPFIPFTPITLGQLLRRRMNEYYTTITRSLHPTLGSTNTSTMYISDPAVTAILNERNVEYIEWRYKPVVAQQQQSTTSSHTATTDGVESMDVSSSLPVQHSMKMVVDGARAIDDHNPIITKLYTQLHQVVLLLSLDQQQNQVLVLDYDTTTSASAALLLQLDRGIWKLCDWIYHNGTDANMVKEEGPIYRNCSIIRRFRI